MHSLFVLFSINLSKFCTRRTSGKALILQFYFLDVLPRHTNIMISVGCLSNQMCKSVPLEKECTFSFWGDIWGNWGEIYTSDSIANIQRMLTEINESGAIAKVIILVEKDTVKHLKTSGTISSKISVLLHILCWW